MSTKSKPSGEHPAVQTYRKKLESIADNPAPSQLDQELTEYLKQVKTPIPPPLGEGLPPDPRK